MNRLFFSLFVIFWTCSLTAQIKGVVVGTGKKPIASVHVKNMTKGTGAVSDSLGVFYINAKENDILEFHHINYQPFYVSLTSLNIDTIALQKKDFALEEINVSSSSSSAYAQSNLVGINRIPSFLGEHDVLKYIATLPGVTSLGMLDAGIYVRGGNSSQNAYLVNGVPVADPQHIGGLLSTFDPYILSRSKFYKSGFPSKYNGYLSSYIDMDPVDYLKEDFTSEISLGLLASSVKTKMKPGKSKKSLLGISFRQSYFQLLAQVYNKNNENKDEIPSYSFNDLTVSYVAPINKQWELTAFSMLTTDHLPIDAGDRFNYGLKWNTLSNSLFIKGILNSQREIAISLGHNSDGSDVETKSSVESNSHTKTRQIDFRAEIQDRLSSRVKLTYGVNAWYKNYAYTQKKESLFKNNLSNKFIHLYGEGRVGLNQNWSVITGLNFAGNFNRSLKVFMSPRMKLGYSKGVLAAWVDYANTRQFEERMNIFTVQSPVDLWLPYNGEIPSGSDQMSIGTKWRINTKMTLSSAIYYKYLHHTKEFTSFNRADLSESIDKMIDGSGRSVGGELDWIYQTNLFYTRINYTLSDVKVRYDEINQGEYFHPSYDVRHNILANISVQLKTHIKINLLWTYQSGVTATVPDGVAVAKDIGDNSMELIPVYINRYNYRLPSTHRLDLDLEYQKVKNNHVFKFSAGVYNLYNQMNPSFVFVKAEPKDDYYINFKLNSKVIFPFMPYFAVSYVFNKAGK